MTEKTITLTLSEKQFQAVLCAMDNSVNIDYIGDEWFESAWKVLNQVAADNR